MIIKTQRFNEDINDVCCLGTMPRIWLWNSVWPRRAKRSSVLQPNANGGSDKRGDKKHRRISVTSVWNGFGVREKSVEMILMILMKWKFMLIGLVERFGGTCIRSCGPNSQQLFFPGVSAGGAIGFVWAYRFWDESPSWPWVASSLYYSLLLSYPWLQVNKINMQLKMQTCQRLGREFLNLSRLLWFVFPFLTWLAGKRMRFSYVLLLFLY